MSRARDLADAGSKANFLDNVTANIPADVQTSLDAKAPTASPAFTGTPNITGSSNYNSSEDTHFDGLKITNSSNGNASLEFWHSSDSGSNFASIIGTTLDQGQGSYNDGGIKIKTKLDGTLATKVTIDGAGKTVFEGEAQAKKFWGLTKVADFGSGGAVNSGNWYSAVALSSLETGALYLFNAYHSQYSSLYWGLFWVIKTSSTGGYVDKIFPANNETNNYQGRISSNHVQFIEVNAGWNGPTHYGQFYKVHYFYSS
tara:strand:- start:508 stop:1278 length:771 start_codon:yes stop_codon:yes gene_type:complete